jgi:asparagine synthase (glutamine-hydrolysing)
MCGIAGIWNRSGELVSPRQLAPFTDSMAHRGPDGRGLWFSPKGNLGLGHRRLSILDLSPDGAQPMATADGRYVISYNGEIFNFLEIRRELESLGCRFRSQSDTEVILQAFAIWGHDCVYRFNGMWAFTLWDERKQELWLCRDRFGVKPLFYSLVGGTLAFASELKAFASLPGFPLSIDAASLASQLNAPHERELFSTSLLENVSNLRAGSWLRVGRRGTPRPHRWWRTTEHLDRDVPSTHEDRVEKFRALFDDASRLRMRSDVPVGAALSGGLDSSSVVSTMSHLTKSGAGHERAGAWGKAFVASSPGTSQDETHYALELARSLGIEAVVEEIRPEAVVTNVQRMLWDFEGSEQLFGSVWLLYRRMRAEGIVVTLDGHGGDELLGGYLNRYREHVESSIRPSEVRTRPYPRPSWFDRLPRHRHCDWWRFDDETPFDIASERQSPWMRLRAPTVDYSDYQRELHHLREWHPLDRQLYVDFHMVTQPKSLRNFDRLAMAHGVESRAPFLDYRLAAYVFALPHSEKIRQGYTKVLLRDAMKGRMPDSIRLRKSKLGFEDPWYPWLTGPLRPLVLDTVRSAGFLASEVWDGKRISKLAELCLNGNDGEKERRGRLARVWRCVQAYLWETAMQERSRAPMVLRPGRAEALLSTANGIA